MKIGDTWPPFQVTLRNWDNTPRDLSACLGATFVMRRYSTFTAQTGDVVNAPATVTSATAGMLAYSWSASDTTGSGLYCAYFSLRFPTGTETVPDNGCYFVNIAPETVP